MFVQIGTFKYKSDTDCSKHITAKTPGSYNKTIVYINKIIGTSPAETCLLCKLHRPVSARVFPEGF
jgi:hypothetical protein